MNKTQSQTEGSKAGDLPRNGQTCKELLEIGEAAYEAICMVYDPNKDYRKFNYNSYERIKSLFYKYTNKKCNAHAVYNYNALFSALYNKFSLLQDYFRETPCYEHYPARVDFLYAFIFYLIRKKYVTLYRLQQAVKQAIDKNAPELLEALCKNGIDLNFTYNEDGQAEEVQSDTAASIFYWALKLRGEGAIVNIILAYHPKLLNAKVFKKQETCLHRAAGEGHIAMVKLLLAKGAKVNPSNKKGYTPLDKAIAGDHLEVFKVLLAHNGRIRDAHKMSMVSAAVKCGGEGLKILAYLVSKDPGCVTMQDPDKVGDTPLHWATREHNLDGLQILSQCCIGWRDVKNKQGKKPLAVAHPDLVLKIEAFSQIKRFWLPLLGGQSRNDLCGICQESDRLYRTKCNHCFHQGCINRLVRSNIIEYIAYNNWRDCKDWRRLGHRCPCCRKRL